MNKSLIINTESSGHEQTLKVIVGRFWLNGGRLSALFFYYFVIMAAL